MSSTGAAAAGVTEREQAVAEGYREYGPALFTYVCRLLGGDRHHAEDLVQETLLRCWSKYRAGDSKKLRPWLFVVAHNLVMTLVQQRIEHPET